MTLNNLDYIINKFKFLKLDINNKYFDEKIIFKYNKDLEENKHYIITDYLSFGKKKDILNFHLIKNKPSI